MSSFKYFLNLKHIFRILTVLFPIPGNKKVYFIISIKFGHEISRNNTFSSTLEITRHGARISYYTFYCFYSGPIVKPPYMYIIYWNYEYIKRTDTHCTSAARVKRLPPTLKSSTASRNFGTIVPIRIEPHVYHSRKYVKSISKCLLHTDPLLR